METMNTFAEKESCHMIGHVEETTEINTNTKTIKSDNCCNKTVLVPQLSVFSSEKIIIKKIFTIVKKYNNRNIYITQYFYKPQYIPDIFIIHKTNIVKRI